MQSGLLLILLTFVILVYSATMLKLKYISRQFNYEASIITFARGFVAVHGTLPFCEFAIILGSKNELASLSLESAGRTVIFFPSDLRSAPPLDSDRSPGYN